MSQTSSSYPSFNNDWTDSTFVTEYYDMYDYHDTEDDGYEDEYNEFENYDCEWIDMSDIPEDLTFEEPELTCILENLQKGRKGSGKYHRKGRKGFGKGEFRDKEGGKSNRTENNKHVRLKLQGDRLNRGWIDQPTRATYKGRSRPQLAHVDDLLTRTRCFKCGELGHLARNCSQKKEDDPSLFSGVRRQSQIPRPFSVAWRETISILRPFLPSRKGCFCQTQTLTRRKERFCSTQTLM